MRLYQRDYSLGLKQDEKKELRKIKESEVILRKNESSICIRQNKYREYPEAARFVDSLFPNNFLDPVKLSDINYIEKIYMEFKELINSEKCTERQVLNFINNKKYYQIIGAILCENFRFGHHSAYLFKEFNLGTDYTADYLLIGKSSGGYSFVFVELESVYGHCTLKDGELGNNFRKGIKQVIDWNRWIQSNYSTFYGELEKIKNKGKNFNTEFFEYDETRFYYVVICGRRNDFNETTYRTAREFRKEKNIYLFHYDNLIDFTEELINRKTY